MHGWPRTRFRVQPVLSHFRTYDRERHERRNEKLPVDTVHETACVQISSEMKGNFRSAVLVALATAAAVFVPSVDGRHEHQPGRKLVC